MAKDIFGLDIGRSFVKIVEVKYSGNKKILTAANTIATNPGGILSDSPAELKNLSESIKKCYQSANVNSRRCVISLIESQVVTRLIQLPSLTDKELSAAIKYEAEQYIPLPIKDVTLQYKIISKPTDPGAKMDILLVAAPIRVVTKYINVAKGAGLEVEALETESSALTRALNKPTDPTIIILSLGALSSELVISKGGNVLFTRSIATGGSTLTKAIMAEFNLPQSQAEQYKQTYGIQEDKLSGKLAAALKPILDILISETIKAVEFARTHVQNSQVTRIVVCGGGGFMPGLSQFITEKTNLEVSLADPWADFSKEGIILKLPGMGSIYAVATGLALWR